jgi:endonuclease YncB( thermonuclease family)
VTKVIDGRTIVIQDKPNSWIQVQLQALAVPDPEQSFSIIVREHLEKLLLGKTASFEMKGILIGKVLSGGIDISGQMLRDGAGWYDLPEENSHTQNDRENYLALETAAKTEKRGVWGIEGLKPVWEFRAEQEAEKKRQQEALIKKENEELELTAKNDKLKKSEYKPPVILTILPDKIRNATFLDADVETPKGFVVVGLGYLKNDKDKLLKAVKKPETGDTTCSNFPVPSTYAVTQNVVSGLCPYSGYGNNAYYITNATALSKFLVKDALIKTNLAYRMYKISGNYAEFASKATDATEAVTNAYQHLSEGNLKNYLLLASEALRDCILVRSARSGAYEAKLSGSALIALNDKYDLDDVSESILDDAIFRKGRSYMNEAALEAERLGMITTKK